MMEDEAIKDWEAVPAWVVMTIQAQAEDHYGAGRLERAGESYERLVEMRPKASQYWAMLGVVARRQGRWVAGLKALQRAVELAPQNRNAMVNLGELLICAGKLEEGVEVLNAVFEMGLEPGLSVEEQDMITRRAGAQLAMMERLARGVLQGEI